MNDNTRTVIITFIVATALCVLLMHEGNVAERRLKSYNECVLQTKLPQGCRR